MNGTRSFEANVWITDADATFDVFDARDDDGLMEDGGDEEGYGGGFFIFSCDGIACDA